MSAAVTRCSGGCGRLSAKGFDTCCRTCTYTKGAKHGPRCDARTSERILEVFKRFDLDGNGTIEPSELTTVTQQLDPEYWDDERIIILFSAMDTNADGLVDVKEMLDWLFDKPDDKLFDVEAAGEEDERTDLEKLEADLKNPLTFEAFALEVDGFQQNGGRPRRLGQIADREELIITENAAFKETGQMSKISALIDAGDDLPPTMRSLFRAAGLRRFALANDVVGPLKPHALRYALTCAKLLGLTESQGFDDAASLYAELLDLPWEWDVCSMVASEGYSMIFKAPATPEVQTALQILLNDTFDPRWTRDRIGDLPTRMLLKQATEVQNAENWAAYCSYKNSLSDFEGDMWCPDDINTMHSSALPELPDLDPTVSEAWLFHGTSPYAAECITSGDFRISLAGTTAGTLFGNGVYTAESCAKSDDYASRFETAAGTRFMLVCRVILGKMHVAKESIGERCRTDCIENGCHSTLGERRYREFIVYDERQIYPAYVVEYQAN